MALSAFEDKSKEPRTTDVKRVLGSSHALWNELIAYANKEYAPLDETWVFSGAQWGWSLRLKRKKRAVLYLTPCNKHFLVGFALGEKAVEAAHAAPLSDSVLAVIDSAPKYAEGRGVRIEVRTNKDLAAVKDIAAIKMAN